VKTLDEIKQILEAQEEYLAAEYGVTVTGVFGSYVRGDQRPDSDVDILIELERPPRISSIGLVELEHHYKIAGVSARALLASELVKIS